MTTLTADKISDHDMQGSVISVNISWSEFFSFLAADEFQHVSCCWTAKVPVLNAFM